MSRYVISKIVSGGQTGVDRAALDVAIYLDIPHGGWCPLGRRSENGKIPDIYQLRETSERRYTVRTEKNVVDSDGTLILYRKQMAGGTELTYRLVRKHKRPCLAIDLDEAVDETAKGQSDRYRAFSDWVIDFNVNVLNVAGPRESTSQGVGRLAEAFLVKALSIDDAHYS